MAEIRRQTAYKLNINQILSASYTQMQGWEPNFLQINSIKVSRVNLIAIIIGIENNTITVDDGSGTLQLRAFQETYGLNKIKIGDMALIIARPREYGSERYLVPEIIRPLENKKWLEYRKEELNHKILTPIKVMQEIQEQPVQSTNALTIIIEKIKELDKGDGADIELLIQNLKIETPDKHITTLLNEGEIFEIRPGKLKVLD
jgi:adenosine/AMP kinase